MPSRMTPNRSAAFALAVTLCAAVIAGCASKTVEVYEPAADSPSEQATFYDDRPFAVVLRDNVKGSLVDYTHLAQQTAPLDEYLEHVTNVGPTRTPNFFRDDAGRAAYYINTYNACVLKAVLAAGVPSTMYDVGSPRLEYDYRFVVDGNKVSLEDLRELAREAVAGDARVEFTFCNAAKGSPPLSAQPFRSYNLVERLDHLAQEAMDNPAMVQVDHENRQLLVAQAIWTQREAMFAYYCKTTGSRSATMLNCLMQFASGIRRQYLSRAAGYQVRLLPFERALNAWAPE